MYSGIMAKEVMNMRLKGLFQKQQMMRTVRSYLERRRRDPAKVMRYFHEESVRYAAA